MADFDRFRSFAERYIIARAALFRTGHEKEDAWLATQDAKTIYNNVEAASKDPNVCDNFRPAGQVGSSANQTGATGPTGPAGNGASASHAGVTAAAPPAAAKRPWPWK